MSEEELKAIIEQEIYRAMETDPEVFDSIASMVASDENCKYIQKLMADDSPLSDDDLALLLQMSGVEPNEDEDIDDSLIDSYADNLRNYLYTYKPEATAVDSSIDPEQEQIGIMAQDLEKVNPACVKETPEGVKTVDTRRLSLMNAGVIADLARRVRELEAQTGV